MTWWRGGGRLGVLFTAGELVGVWTRGRGADVGAVALARERLAAGPDGDRVALALSRLAASLGAPRGPVHGALDDTEAVVRLTRVPPMPVGELRQAVRLDAHRFVPFEPDQAYIDYAVVGREEGEAGAPGQWRLAVAAAPRSRVDAVLTAARRARLAVADLEVEAVCLGRAVEALGAPTEAAALVDVHSAEAGWTVKVTCFGRGVPLVVRSLAGLTSPQDVAPALVPLLQFFASQNHPIGLTQVWVSGSGTPDVLPSLRDAVRDRLSGDLAVEERRWQVGGRALDVRELAAWGASLGEGVPNGLWR
ncbi:MAG: pilus assembly protein PilM [Firmicutes bacterium]|nr:pilus assembly protein PilM [Bacillota bacterium]